MTLDTCQLGANLLLMNKKQKKEKERKIHDIYSVTTTCCMVSKRVVSSQRATGYKMSLQYRACLFIVNSSVR